MIELLEAIKAFFNEDASGPLSATFPGGLYFNDAPAGDLDKYLVLTSIANPNTAAYGRAAVMEEPDIQFAVWGVGASVAGELMRAITAAFDDVDLTLAGGRTMTTSLRLNGAMPMPGSGEKNKTGGKVFGWQVTYRFAVSN